MAIDIKQLQFLSCIRLDVSTWSGRAKLRREDLPSTAELPPETLATMGTKRLFDPDALKIFQTLKARAVSLLDKNAVRFLGGWATHEDRLPALAVSLQDIADEFEREKFKFIQNYVKGVAQWAGQFPEWSNILINSVPKVHELQGKFSFAWQMYKLSPAENVPEGTGNNLHSTIKNLDISVLREISETLQEAYKECFSGKETVTKRAFRPIHTVVEKLKGLSFLHPHVAGLENILRDSLAIVEGTSGSPQAIDMFKNLLLALGSPSAIASACDRYIQAADATDFFDPFWVVHVPGVNLLEQPAPVLDKAAIDARLAALAAGDPLPTLDGGGLW